jgi:hypothetical protein
MLRGLIEAIVLTPQDGQLRIELRGNRAAMLTAAKQTRRSPETGDLLVPVQLVAGGATSGTCSCSAERRDGEAVSTRATLSRVAGERTAGERHYSAIADDGRRALLQTKAVF